VKPGRTIRTARILTSLLLLALVALALQNDRPRAAGNIEVITKSGTAIGNKVWPDVSLPIRWFFHNPTSFAACSYASANAPVGTLQGANEAAFNTWQALPDSRISFTYAGTSASTVRSIGFDGVNLVTFCDAGVLGSNLGFVAQTPSTALTAPFTVTAGGGCPAGQGAVGPVCLPVGTYPAGTTLDADIRYNTFGTTEQTSYSTNGTTPGSIDIESVALHEQGHWFGLSHDPLSSAIMFPFVDDLPFSEAVSKRLLRTSDASIAGRYYPEASYAATTGAITGKVTLDGAAADGVHVVAIDPVTMLGVTGRYPLSRFADTDALGPDGADFVANGAGFYRIDGLPPGQYYVYVEYFDNSEFLSARLQNRYNSTIGNSNVTNGNAGSTGQVGGWKGFIPQLPEFYNTGESGNGGDGINAGAALDNSDVATLVTVNAGQVTSGINIDINIEPVNGQTPANRQNPTTRAVLPNDAFQGSDRVTGFILNGGGNDFYAVRFPAGLLPTPPYNVAEGLWNRGGKNTKPYINRLVYGDPANPNNPALNDPILASPGRVLTGGPNGGTSGGDLIDVRDQWNVTINDSRDVWVVLNQPDADPNITLITQGYFVLVARTTAGTARVGRTRLTQDGGATWGTLTADAFYDLVTEADAPVMVTGASPVAREEGERADVSVLGTGFQDGATVSFGPGITVNSVDYISPTELKANVKITDTGATGPRAVNVTVTNPGAVFPNVSRVFTVNPSTNRPPVAVAAAPATPECTSPDGALVTLDGSGSSDPDSTPDTLDDIVSFEWFENYGTPSETLLATGMTVDVQLALGAHDITLRVTDTHDAVDTDTIQVAVVDTTPPEIWATPDPTLLWPPNHGLVDITVNVGASDLCGPATVSLVSLVSSEPDDAQGGGDGHTEGDVQGADLGTADAAFALRAERLGGGNGRTYTAHYIATDAANNTASLDAVVDVPHSMNGVTEPLMIALTETGEGTVVDWTQVPGAQYYHVIRGRVKDIRDAGASYDVGAVTCVEAMSADNSTAGRADAEQPEPGEIFFYLATWHDTWTRSYGTERAQKDRVPRSGECTP
jgi:hypothetical protein